MGTVLSCVSNIMYLSEKITLWLTCVGLIFCIITTFVVTLGMGIGLGYNYCFVDLKTRYKYVPGHYVYPGSPRWPHRAGDGAAEGSLLPDEPAESQDDTTVLSEDDELRKPPTLPPEGIITEPTSPNLFVKNISDVPYQPSFNDTEDLDETTQLEAITEPSSDYSMDSSIEFNATIDEVTTFSTDVETETEAVETSTPTVDDSQINYDANDDRIDTGPQPTMGDDPTNRRVKKLVIPISGGDLVSLLSKLRGENKNYSLQIVTT